MSSYEIVDIFPSFGDRAFSGHFLQEKF